MLLFILCWLFIYGVHAHHQMFLCKNNLDFLNLLCSELEVVIMMMREEINTQHNPHTSWIETSLCFPQKRQKPTWKRKRKHYKNASTTHLQYMILGLTIVHRRIHSQFLTSSIRPGR